MVDTIRARTFAEVEASLVERAHRMVWCNVATVDGEGRPRSRLLHPIWDGGKAWILTRRGSYKAHQIEANPHVSLAYVSEIASPVYAECVAFWENDPSRKQRIWDLFAAAPPPLGYDPGPLFGHVDHPDAGLLRLEPWLVILPSFPQSQTIWRA
ncbi:MAG: pyridoxamine 5'-phosphate oxidase family protein [Chloroflexota bacterium]